MKTINGYIVKERQPIDGDTVYDLKWQCFSVIRKLKEGVLVAPHPTLKMAMEVGATTLVVEKSHLHKIVIHDHGKRIYETLLIT